MEDIKKLFEDVRRIRIAVEKIAGPVEQNTKQEETQVASVIQPTVQPNIIQGQVVPTAIPTTTQVESFTQEQLAVAMSNAVAVGKNDVVMRILSTFNVQTLMQLAPTYYNQVATMLREAGIQV